MKNQRFGIEIEMTGLTRNHASRLVAGYFNSESIHEGGTYDTYTIKDQQGRKWKIVSDASINAETSRHHSANPSYRVEFVSPICRYDDIEDIQEIVRKLRKEGHARVNSSCGIHIHIDASVYDARSLRNLTNIMYSKEDLIYKALKVSVSREYRYCRKVDNSFIEELNRRKPKNLEQVEKIWYKGDSSRKLRHYDDSRYHALNLHSVFSKGTIEFRLFNGTLHAGEIKSYIQFCLAVSHQALTQTKASRRKTHSTNEKYTFRTWLLRLGLIGDDFKTARYHLLKNLDGCIAWKDPHQAVLQKERLQQRRQEQAMANEDRLTEESENMEQSMTQQQM